MHQLQLCQILILPLASGHGAGRLPGDSTLCTSYPAPTRKTHPRLPTLEVAERAHQGDREESPPCQWGLWQSPLRPILPPASPLSGPTKCPEVP